MNYLLSSKKAFDDLKAAHAAELTSVINLHYYNGEYLDGWMPSKCHNVLGDLDLARYVSGWGTLFDSLAQKHLGESFTLQQCFDLVEPYVIKREENLIKKAAAETERIAGLIALAKETGKPQIVRQWSEDCNDPEEECSCDNIYEFIDENGKRTRERNHTW